MILNPEHEMIGDAMRDSDIQRLVIGRALAQR